MESKQQLLDSLTAHISLYHHSSQAQTQTHNPNPRPAILRWFSSLPLHHRRAHLTTLNPKFLSILLQMLHNLQSNGPGRFLLLPDLPQNDLSALPSLCFRQSHGLLLRSSQSNPSLIAIRQSVQLFSSREGEEMTELPPCLDSMCVGEGLVEDVDLFVKIMDEVSSGGFLRGGEEGEVGAEWAEMAWLKAKGYYTVEEFVANRIEVALRLAWLSCCSTGKKRGVKLKEGLSGVGMAANVFWRKKGCVDWWEKLDESVRRKVFCAFLGKAAKSLTVDMLKGKDNNNSDGRLWRSCCEGEQPLRCNLTALGRGDASTFKVALSKIKRNSAPARASGDASPLNYMFNSLSILQVISNILLAYQHGGCDAEQLFFSSLDSVNSISDVILRKFRVLAMVISLDCTKFELLGEGNRDSRREKLNDKCVSDKRKKRGKNRNKKTSSSSSPNDDRKPSEPAEGKGDMLLCRSKEDVGLPNNVGCKVQGKRLGHESHLSADTMEPIKEANNGKSRTAARKSRKERKKLKSSISENSEVASCQSSSARASSDSVSSQGKALMADWTSGSSTLGSMSNHVNIAIDRPETNQSVRRKPKTHVMKQYSKSDCSSETGCHDSSRATQSDTQDSGDNCLNRGLDPLATTIKPSVGCIDDKCSSVTTCESYVDSNKICASKGYCEKQTKGDEPEGKPSLVQEQGSVSVLRVGPMNSPAYVSYEWPNLAPIHPSGNAHLPAATDRLHLDVGHNWKNHFHHSFVQPLRVRNSPFDNGYNGIISRPLPMSLDWPPVVRGGNILVPSVTCNYDSEFISRRQTSLQQGFSAQNLQCSRAISEDERTISSELVDFHDVSNSLDPMDEHDKNWMSEEDSESYAASGMDYNQFFGGGVMYWNPSDHPATSFSRPPSLCSDDSSWAWREADMNRAVDDMVAFSSSYSTNGLTSPSAASFCSPFDPLGSGALGYVMPGNEITGKVLHPSATMADVVAEESVSGSISNIPGDGEVKTVDSLPYPILRPIIIPNMSRETSRSDFNRNYDHKSPCIPPNRREQPHIKRPPSPVVLCVPRAPRPPPPSPAGDSRRHRGFPPVRSGSSSPRHWGVKGWFHEGVNFEEACIPLDGSELVWPSWRSKNVSARQLTQPLAGKLLQDRLIAISQLARDQEHPDVTFPLQPPELLNSSSCKASLSLIHDMLHKEIDTFCKQVAAENLIRKPYVNWAVKRVARSLQVLWPRSRTNVFGSNATGLSLPSSDVDLVICLPPVRNLEPIKEAGILEGRNGIKETCLQHAARYLANQEWVKSDSLKIVENTAIPIIMLVVEVPPCFISSTMPNVLPTPKEEADKVVASEEGHSFQSDAASSESSTSPKWSKITNDTDDGVKTVRLDISFKSPTHTGLQTTGLVKDLVDRFPAVTPLALVLKQFLADLSLDQSYSGGLSSYCLTLLITRFLQHEHHQGRPTNQNYGSLLMDFLYFFGNVFDPRQMRISVQGSGVYLTRERGYSIDPLYIDDPLFLTNNVGKNCFRIHQCIKAFADAYTVLENELRCLPDDNQKDVNLTCKLLPKIIPSIGHLVGP